MNMAKPDANIKSAKSWILSEGVAEALKAISIGTELSKSMLMAARPMGGLHWSHVYELLEYAATVASAAHSARCNQGVILYRWLLAAEHDLVLETMPSLPDKETKEVKALFSRCKRAAVAHKKGREPLEAQLRMARQRCSTQAESNARAKLEAFEREAWRPFSISAQGSGGDGGGDSAAATQQQVPIEASLLAFAMGTHWRLGAASLVQRLDADALGQIAAAVRGNRPPPPSELMRLRRLVAAQLRQEHRLRAANEEVRTELAEARRRGVRDLQAARQEEHAKTFVVKQLLAAELRCAEVRAARASACTHVYV